MPLLIKHKKIYHIAEIDIKASIGVLSARFTNHKILSVSIGNKLKTFSNIEDLEKCLLSGDEIIVTYSNNRESYKRQVTYRFMKYYS